MPRSQTSSERKFLELQPQGYRFFHKCQNNHLGQLGRLVFWICLALYESAWSASRAEAATLANFIVDCDSTQYGLTSPLVEGNEEGREKSLALPSLAPDELEGLGCAFAQSENRDRTENEGSTVASDTSTDEDWSRRFPPEPREVRGAIQSDAGEQSQTEVQKDWGREAIAKVERGDVSEDNEDNKEDKGTVVSLEEPQTSPQNTTEYQEQKQLYSITPPTSLIELEFSSQVALKGNREEGTGNRESPYLTARDLSNVPRVDSSAAVSSLQPDGTFFPEQISSENLSNTEQSESGEDPDLGILRLRELAEPSPVSQNRSDSEQSESGEDPDLGILRLRELAEPPPPPSEPTAYLLGRVGYFRSNNIFSGVDPVDDGLLRTGLTLLVAPSLGPRTSLFASVGGNLIRYGRESESDYNELRFNAGIRQQIANRTYGEVGWSNRQLFTEEGDRFLNDHSVYLELNRQDSLAKKLTLDTYYQLRFSFADPESRSQIVNYLGASLGYNLSPSLRAALDYRFALADFTERKRLDEYHQLTARLTYTLSRNTEFYLFGGGSLGGSSDPRIDFDGLVFGAGVDFSLTLF